MSDFLKSAMGYFNTVPENAFTNEFVGQLVEVGAVTLRVKRVIAEGLFCKRNKERKKKQNRQSPMCCFTDPIYNCAVVQLHPCFQLTAHTIHDI